MSTSSGPGFTILTEDQVVDAVERHLRTEGWSILSKAKATERGTDLVATKDRTRLEVEAKGAGSSKAGTARYGSLFNKGQVFDHVAKAVLVALRVASSGRALAAVALPDNAHHRAEIERVASSLQTLGVTVFWVSDRGHVTTSG